MAKKRKLIKKEDSTTKQQQKKKQKTPISKNPSGSDSDSDPVPENLQKLLEPYSKDQLLSLAVDTSLSHPSFYNLIRSTADKDITHRKIFVYGLARETTRQTLFSVFEQFGQVEECNVVIDHVTGKAKGYAFVLFNSRKSATKALKQPQIRINNRLASCKLASMKQTAVSETSTELGNRKIYVSNVPTDVNSEYLRTFFAKFGEIEVGPMGFDPRTGKSKGYALFVYKTAEAAKRCLKEPYKMFDDRQLHCKKAAEGKSGSGVASITTEIVQPPLLAMPSLAAPQNMAMMNPFYGGILANPYAGGYMSPFVGVGGAYGQQVGYGGMLDSLGGRASVLGAYGTIAGGSSGGLFQHYPNKQVGQRSPAKLPRNIDYS